MCYMIATGHKPESKTWQATLVIQPDCNNQQTQNMSGPFSSYRCWSKKGTIHILLFRTDRNFDPWLDKNLWQDVQPRSTHLQISPTRSGGGQEESVKNQEALVATPALVPPLNEANAAKCWNPHLPWQAQTQGRSFTTKAP